jgi:hypothetical protein
MTVLLYFLPLSLVIALVLSATKKDALRDILWQGLRLFALLALGTIAFSALLFICQKNAVLLFAFLGSLLAVLAFFTLKGAFDWALGLGKKEEKKVTRDT